MKRAKRSMVRRRWACIRCDIYRRYLVFNSKDKE